MARNQTFDLSEAKKLQHQLMSDLGLRLASMADAVKELCYLWPLVELAASRWVISYSPKSEATFMIVSEEWRDRHSDLRRPEAEALPLVIASLFLSVDNEERGALERELSKKVASEVLDEATRLRLTIGDKINVEWALDEISDHRSLLHVDFSTRERQEIVNGDASLTGALKSHGIKDAFERAEFMRAQSAVQGKPEWFATHFSRGEAKSLFEKYADQVFLYRSFDAELWKSASRSFDVATAVGVIMRQFGYSPNEIWDNFFEDFPAGFVHWFVDQGIDPNAYVSGKCIKTSGNSTYCSEDHQRTGHPLNIAARGGNYELARALLKAGADIAGAMVDGPSLILYAVPVRGSATKAAHERMVEHLEEFSGREIAKAGWKLTAYQLATDAQHKRMATLLKDATAPAKVKEYFEPIAIPKSIEPADWLIQHLGLENRPIATWSGRHLCPFLVALAEACSKFPGVFDSSADRHLRYANYWVEEQRTKIVGLKNLDRRASFVGAMPWTSSEYPWPLDGSGKPLAPVLQLNLSQLCLDRIDFADNRLVQIWGDHTYPVLRLIPLKDIENIQPDNELYPWSNEYLGYRFEGYQDDEDFSAPSDIDWYEKRVVGELVEAGENWEFSVSRDIEIDAEWPQEWESDPAMADVVAALDETWEQLNDLAQSATQISDHTCDGFFGGQMYGRQTDFYDFEDYLTVYSPRALFAADGPGLVTLYDGTLSVLKGNRPEDIIAYVDR